MQPDAPGPDPKDLQFRSRERIAEDLGVGVSEGDAGLIAYMRTRSRWFVAVQVLVIVSVTGWVLFTQYHPGVGIPVPTYLLCLFTMAAGGISVGAAAFRDFDAGHHARSAILSTVEQLQFAPLAGLVGWGTGMVLFWRYLHSWDPGKVSFFVTNPFGMYFLSMGVSLLAMPLIVWPLVETIASLRGKREP